MPIQDDGQAQAASAHDARIEDLERALVRQRSLMQTYMTQLQGENAELSQERHRLRRDNVHARERLVAIEAEHVLWSGLKSADRLVELDFPIRPRVRSTTRERGMPAIRDILETGADRYAGLLTRMLAVVDRALAIEHRTEAAGEPSWINDWIPAFDAISIYGLLALNNPERYVEIGSGVSTKFARRAIRDFGLRTQIISIDPFPRSEVEAICDHSIRSPLENVDLGLFGTVSNQDMVFCDCSHRSFQNSDVTVFFTEILPMIGAGAIVGVHDIFLPFDYPEEWLTRYYSEQYLLACLLLGGGNFQVELPVYFCTKTEALHGILKPLWDRLGKGVNCSGGAFWLRPVARP